VKNSDTLKAENFDCKISKVEPTTGLNILGGDNLTFSGELLPRDISTSKIEVNFDDGTKTTCVPQASTSIAMICLTSPFEKTVKGEQEMVPTIKING
jgi:hypothetical protein